MTLGTIWDSKARFKRQVFRRESFPDLMKCSDSQSDAQAISRTTDDGSKLIYPARLSAAIRLILIFGRDVIAVLVESDFAVVVAHVDFEFSGCAATLPPVIRVTHAEVLL